MFYSILRQIVAVAFKIYFRKIYLVGKDKVPLQGPLLIAANHPMAFSEACLLACFLDRPLHFLVRGDVFKSNWNWFFKLTNQIPIYRFRDGFSNMRKNTNSFQWAYQALADEKAILIFAEGNTKLQKKLSPLQKGVARLAFGAAEHKDVERIKVVPVGINYTDGQSFRSEVMIQVGVPLNVDNYLTQVAQDKNDAAKQLTQDLHKLMEPLVIHIEDPADEPLANDLFQATGSLRSFNPWPVLDPDPSPFAEQKGLADRLNKLEESEKNLLKSKLQSSLTPKQETRVEKVIRIVKLVLLLPLALLGFVVNAAPFYLAKWISANKVKQIEFYTPVRITLMIVCFSIYYLVLSVLLVMGGGWSALLIIPVIILAGYSTILWWEIWNNSFCPLRINQDIMQMIYY